MICFTAAFGQQDDQAVQDLDALANGSSTTKATTPPTAKTTSTTNPTTATKTPAPATKTPAPQDTSCGTNHTSCTLVNHDDKLCTWNDEVIAGSKTDFHYEKSGVCPCPDEGKDLCNVFQRIRKIRNIPALQAWSASVFLLSICIAGKIHRIIRHYLYHCYFQKSPYVTHR